MKIEMRKITDLALDAENAREHDAPSVAAIVKSLEAFGQRKPIVINKAGVVIAGNGTLEAAEQLGWAEIAVVEAPADWDEAMQRAYAIADNRTGELSAWDRPALLEALQSLPEPLLESVGFDEKEIDSLTKIWGEAPNLDALYDQIGEPTEEDGMTRITIYVPFLTAEKWKAALKATGLSDVTAATSKAIDAAFESLT
jgi:ParB-like chromosome segregation protein Spo0J